jgi:hypothetical protein
MSLRAGFGGKDGRIEGLGVFLPAFSFLSATLPECGSWFQEAARMAAWVENPPYKTVSSACIGGSESIGLNRMGRGPAHPTGLVCPHLTPKNVLTHLVS